MFGRLPVSIFTILVFASLFITSAVISSIVAAKPTYAFPGFFPPQSSAHVQDVAKYDKMKNCATDQHTPTNFKSYLTHFSCGHVQILANGTVVRHFTLIATVVSGSSRDEIDSILDRNTGSSSFAFVISGDDLHPGQGKPDHTTTQQQHTHNA